MATASERLPPSHASTRIMIGHVATTIMVAQIKARRKGRMIHIVAASSTAMKSTPRVMRVKSRERGTLVIGHAPYLSIRAPLGFGRRPIPKVCFRGILHGMSMGFFRRDGEIILMILALFVPGFPLPFRLGGSSKPPVHSLWEDKIPGS